MSLVADRKAELREATVVDAVEASLLRYPRVEMPLVHKFTPGLYIREITMPAGSVVSSMRHKTRHPFFITKGRVAVISEHERVIYEAPYSGITEPGTKRLLYTETDTVWTTVHANPENLTDPDEIVGEITEENDNPLVEDKELVNQWKTKHSPSLVMDMAKNLTSGEDVGAQKESEESK